MGVLTLSLDFIITSPLILVNTAAVSHLVLFAPIGLNIDYFFWSIHGDSCATFSIYLSGGMISTGDFSVGSL